MKKLISKKMIFLYVLIIVSVYTTYLINNKNNITYISIGDEYAIGTNCYGIKEYSYSDYLKDKLYETNQLKNYINNYSYKDYSIKELKNDIINNKKSVLTNQKISFKHSLQDADLLTLSIGINDLKYKILLDNDYSYNKLNNDLNELEKEYDELIDLIKKYYKKDIYVIEYPNTIISSYYLSLGTRMFNNYLKNNKKIKYISIENIEYNSNKFFLNPNLNYYNKDAYYYISNRIYKKYKKTLKNI